MWDSLVLRDKRETSLRSVFTEEVKLTQSLCVAGFHRDRVAAAPLSPGGFTGHAWGERRDKGCLTPAFVGDANIQRIHSTSRSDG